MFDFDAHCKVYPGPPDYVVIKNDREEEALKLQKDNVLYMLKVIDTMGAQIESMEEKMNGLQDQIDSIKKEMLSLHRLGAVY